MGGEGNLKTALDIYTRLRTRAAGGQENTPCNDKDIEITLGRHLKIMGGADNQRKALEIYSRLRTRATGEQVNILSDDKEIELGLASIFIETREWDKFDELQLERPLFSGVETCLCLSIRFFRELTDVEKILPKHSILLGKAFNWAA
ncbi:hypothetical protein E1189_02260, partial [Sansalvadorimonas verongulae]|nr:hypothetical protein [Sansalvadorimonas verongulae]